MLTIVGGHYTQNECSFDPGSAYPATVLVID